MPERTRTFIAIEVPGALFPRLRRLQQEVSTEIPGVGWTTALPFHITLAFLGDVDVTDLKEVCLATAETARAFHRFEIQLQGIGVFPAPERPRVVWAGVTGTGLDTLRALQHEVASTVARLRYPTDARPFHPHVTLGRFNPRRPAGPDLPRQVNRALNRFASWRAGPFRVDETAVFSSTTTSGGSVYAALGRAALDRPKVDRSA